MKQGLAAGAVAWQMAAGSAARRCSPARALSYRSWPDQDGPVNRVVRLACESFPPNSVLEAAARPLGKPFPAYGTEPSGPRNCITDFGAAEIHDRQGEIRDDQPE
jgi:hypothetical protein